MTDHTAIAAALLKLQAEMKTCKRNKSGSVNGNAAGAIRNRCAEAIQAAGETRGDSWGMTWELYRSLGY